MGFLSFANSLADDVVGAVTDGIEFISNKFQGENDAEKGTKSLESPAGTNSVTSTSDSEKEATQTTDSDKSSDQGKLFQDPNKLEFYRYPIEVQALGDTIKHWIEIDISDIQSETLSVETLQAGLTDALERGSSLTSSVEKVFQGDFSGLSDQAGAALSQLSPEGIVGGLKRGSEVGTKLTKELKGTIKTVSKESPRNVLRAKLAIYMPDTVFFNQRNNYEERTFDQVFGKLGQFAQIGSAIGAEAASGYEQKGVQGLVNSLMRSPAGREVAGDVVGAFIGAPSLAEGLVKGAGYAINPQVELFFTGVDRRTFQFDFRFNSRSAKETEQIQGIIKALRKYAAPTFPKEGTGRYWIPPSIFDINFCFYEPENGWKINDKLPKINRCVLESIDVNYNGSGKYITYEDGQPIDIEVRLVFKETDIMTRAEIEAGY